MGKTNLLSLLPPTRTSFRRDNLKLITPVKLAVKHVKSKLPKEKSLSEVSKEKVLDRNEENEELSPSNMSESNDDIDQDELSSFFSFHSEKPQDNNAVARERASALSVINSALTKNHEVVYPQNEDSDVIEEKSVVKVQKSMEECLPRPMVDLEVLKEYRDANQNPDTSEDDGCYWSENTFMPGPEVCLS